MTTTEAAAPRPCTLAEYHRLIQAGILHDGCRIELLDGHIVPSFRPHSPPKACCRSILFGLLDGICPEKNWEVRPCGALTLPDSESEPEPDAMIVRDRGREYWSRHPNKDDTAIVIEVADKSLERDQTQKLRIYARAAISAYWIVNLPDRRVEVYTDPQPAADPPCYATRTDFTSGTAVPLVLDSATVGLIAVDEILP